MHYLRDGQWVESKDLIEPDPAGATASQGPLKITFANNLNTPGAVDLLTPDDKRLRFHVLGLAWQNNKTGQRTWLARTKDCQGVILPPNQVLYDDAFDDVLASVRYTYTGGGVESDVILHEQVTPPDGYESADTLLQAVTEFLDVPSPRLAEVKPPNASSVPDVLIDFGAVQITLGRAFAIQDAKGRGPALTPGVYVYKTWEQTGRNALLFESVQYETVRNDLEALGRPEARNGANKKTDEDTVRAFGAESQSRKRRPMQLALGRQPRGGFVIDFVTVYSASTYTFQTDQTYKLASMVSISTYTTFQSGAILKFTSDGYLVVSGGLSAPGLLTARAVCTHVDDDTVGEPLLGDGVPDAKYLTALRLYNMTSSASVQRLEVRYATTGIQFYTGLSQTLRNCIWRTCTVGASAYVTQVTVYELLMCDVTTPTLVSGGAVFYNLGTQIKTDCSGANAPQITSNPTGGSTAVGGSRTFTVSATGFALTYQ
jgi:hypothetical protein